MDNRCAIRYGATQFPDRHRCHRPALRYEPPLAGRRLCKRRDATQFDGNLLPFGAYAKRATGEPDPIANANGNSYSYRYKVHSDSTAPPDTIASPIVRIAASNQTMKPTAPSQNKSSVLATTFCRGLSLSR